MCTLSSALVETENLKIACKRRHKYTKSKNKKSSHLCDNFLGVTFFFISTEDPCKTFQIKDAISFSFLFYTQQNENHTKKNITKNKKSAENIRVHVWM